MKMRRTVLVLLAVALCAAGCKKKKRPKPEPEEKFVRETQFSYVNTDQEVESEQIAFDQGRDLQVDFDGDGKKDIAVIKKTKQGDQVAIYINKAVGRYYVGGKLEKITRGKITGLAVKDAGDHMDLIVLVRERGKTHVIQYKNDGQMFQELAESAK